MNRIHAATYVVFGAIAWLTAASASADTLKPGDERFKFVAGWFLPAFDTDVAIDDTDNEGDDVNLGDDFGLDQDQSGALVGFEWRIADRHRLAASWSQFSQTATRSLDEEITIGDEVFPISAEVRTKWSIDLIPITYSYSFLKSDSNEFAATFGIHWDKISLSPERVHVPERRRHRRIDYALGGPAAAAHRPAVRPSFLGQLVRGHRRIFLLDRVRRRHPRRQWLALQLPRIYRVPLPRPLRSRARHRCLQPRRSRPTSRT